MGKPPIDPNLDARLKEIEKSQRDLSKRQKDLDKEIADQKVLFSRAMDIVADNNNAMTYLNKYMNHFVIETWEQGLMFTIAINKFAGFLGLPPSDKSINPFLDLAFTALATAVPVLRASGLLSGINKYADSWAKTAKMLNFEMPIAGKIAKNIQGIHDVADAVKKANDTRMKAMAEFKDSPTASGLSQLDSSKAPIKSMIETATAAAVTFDKVAESIAAEFAKRIADPKTVQNQSITQMVQAILIPSNFPTDSELEQIGTRYLWEMVQSYCRKNVTIVSANISSIVPDRIEGLNDTQLQSILDMFYGQRTGRYFFQPSYYSYWFYLNAMNVKKRTDHIQLRAG